MLCVYERSVCVCVCVYMCVVEGKTSKYTDLQSLQVSGLLNPFTAVEATWHSAFGRQFSVLKKKKKICSGRDSTSEQEQEIGK